MWKNIIAILLLFGLTLGCTSNEHAQSQNSTLLLEFDKAAREGLLERWYPLVLDTINGGYFSNISYDFQVGDKSEKMIVTQARHLWTASMASEKVPSMKEEYLKYAHHGYEYLRDFMWDTVNGGFYNLVTSDGTPILNFGNEKTAYGNSFAIYGLSMYYAASENEEALNLAKSTFNWLENHSHDSIHKGYFQSLNVNGTPIERRKGFPSISDVGYKDQNSSIHLLEAFTTLYKVWPDEILEERIKELLTLIRDTITNEKDYMNLFFEKDWKPVTFVESPKDSISKHYFLDHVSFGHDVETAYLMLEASHVLGNWEFDETLKKGKKMVDHSLRNGWDNQVGGFYDGGYYFKNEESITIVNDDKNWWSQAEGLNSLLLMHHYFPNDSLNYYEHFNTLWKYTNDYLMDKKHGGWYEWGLDKRPETELNRKGHIWKGAYHNYRALVNCKEMLETQENRKK